MVQGRPEPDPRLVQQVADLALSLPAAYEEDAWTGVRWRVGKRTFAHVAAMRHVDAAEKLGMQPPPIVEYVEAPAAAPNEAAPDRTSSTLAEVHGEAKKSLDP